MNKGQQRVFVAFMALLVLASIGLGAWYYAEQHDITYDEVATTYAHYDAETTPNEVEVNQTLYLKNTTTPDEDAWMVKMDVNPIDNLAQTETYGANYATIAGNDTVTEGKYSLAINRSYVNSTHAYTCRMELYADDYTLLADTGDKAINSNQVTYYVCSRDYTLTDYHVKLTYDEVVIWVTITVHNGVSADMF